MKRAAITVLLLASYSLGQQVLAAEPVKLTFDTYGGYFVSNKFEPDPPNPTWSYTTRSSSTRFSAWRSSCGTNRTGCRRTPSSEWKACEIIWLTPRTLLPAIGKPSSSYARTWSGSSAGPRRFSRCLGRMDDPLLPLLENKRGENRLNRRHFIGALAAGAVCTQLPTLMGSGPPPEDSKRCSILRRRSASGGSSRTVRNGLSMPLPLRGGESTLRVLDQGGNSARGNLSMFKLPELMLAVGLLAVDLGCQIPSASTQAPTPAPARRRRIGLQSPGETREIHGLRAQPVSTGRWHPAGLSLRGRLVRGG